MMSVKESEVVQTFVDESSSLAKYYRKNESEFSSTNTLPISANLNWGENNVSRQRQWNYARSSDSLGIHRKRDGLTSVFYKWHEIYHLEITCHKVIAI